MVRQQRQKENRRFAVGVHHTGFPIGQLTGPFLIGWVLTVGTWRDAFLWLPLIGRRENLEKVNAWIERHQLTPAIPVDDDNGHKMANPLTKLRVALGHRNVWCGLGLALCLLWAETGVTAFLTTQLVEHADMSLAAAAVVSGASGLTGWIVLIAWGLLRNSPFPAVYALVVDSTPQAASSGMGT